MKELSIYFCALIGFGGQTTGSTTVKFSPPGGSDTMMKNGAKTSINTSHQCITAMREYEKKSLEVHAICPFLCEFDTGLSRKQENINNYGFFCVVNVIKLFNLHLIRITNIAYEMTIFVLWRACGCLMDFMFCVFSQELRYEDYTANGMSPPRPAAGSGGLFGGTTHTAQSSPGFGGFGLPQHKIVGFAGKDIAAV